MQLEGELSMAGRIAQMLNLGMAMERRLREVGVPDEESLRSIGAAAAFARLRLAGSPHLTLNTLYAMDAAILGCHWRRLSVARKAELRRLVGLRA
jgi:DNA transformation protein and related proteins